MRGKIHIFVFVVFTTFLAVHPAFSQGVKVAQTANFSFTDLYNQIKHLQPDPRKVVEVTNFSFQRDAAKFHLVRGKLYLLSKVGNRIIGALFRGDGTFSCRPSTEFERKQVRRHMKVESPFTAFNSLFLLFADSTLAELENNLNFGSGEIQEKSGDYVKNCLKYLHDQKGNNFDPAIMKTVLEGEENGFFYAHISKEKDIPLIFRIEPHQVEEVSLSLRLDTRKMFSYERVAVVICQFHKKQDYVSGINLENEKKDYLDIKTYTIESVIKSNLDFSAAAEVEFTVIESGHTWLPFSLYSELKIDSVFNEYGERLNFVKKVKNSTVWFQLKNARSEFEVAMLRIYYHGKLIKRDEIGWIKVRSTSNWYPSYGFRDPALFDLTFHTPGAFKIASVGRLIDSEMKDKVLTTHWVTQEPAGLASFNLGSFKQHQIKDIRIPLVTVYMAEDGHLELSHALGQEGIQSGKDMEKQVAADVANSLAFFQDVFGDTPLTQFYATEAPVLHGEAYPGLIHLSWLTFQLTNNSVLYDLVKDYPEAFRGHEVAHQWWGVGVDSKTYHDAWLVEGLAEFSGLWFMQTTTGNNDKFFNALKIRREKIIKNHKSCLKDERKANPVWLGYRNYNHDDYTLTVYSKGAWIIQMLRNMIIDWQTMNEDRFKNMMSEYYLTYQGKKATTGDFQSIAEKYVGIKLDWFFDQWIFGSAIPTYKFAYNIKKAKDNKYLLQCRVTQENVPDDFKMYVPVLIDFGKDRFYTLRLMVKNSFTEYNLPLMPLKPKKVTLNPFESVLCEVKKVKW